MERFSLPENLAELGGDAIADSETQARSRLEALRSVTNPSQEDIDELAAIKQFRSEVKTLAANRATFAADIAGLDEPVAPVTPEPPAAPAPAPAPAVQPEPEPVAASVEPEVDPEPATRPEPSVEVPEAPARPPLTIVASADIPGTPAGSHLDMGSLSEAISAKARATKNSTQKFYVASIDKQIPEEYDLRNLPNNYAIANRLEELASISYADASMTASGGWCAPSEILYDLFETICPNPNLFSLPTFRANRGGVQWPIYEPIDFTEVVDWIWTEADDIAATGVKPCITVPCPEFTECRLDAHGVCVQIGNFQDRGYPEQVRWFLNRVMFLHARAESLFKLNTVLADADTAAIGGSFAAASAVVGAILQQVQAYNDRNGRCCGATVEAVAPCWLKGAIRADIARQDFGGVGNAGLVSDATIQAWFREAGVSLRFIDFWQALDTPAPAPGPGAITTVAWPTEVDILFYTPGAYVQFDGGTLDLGVVRDSVLNATNDFQTFTEDFYCIGRRGPRGVNVTVPICADGAVGGRNLNPDNVADCPLA